MPPAPATPPHPRNLPRAVHAVRAFSHRASQAVVTHVFPGRNIETGTRTVEKNWHPPRNNATKTHEIPRHERRTCELWKGCRPGYRPKAAGGCYQPSRDL